VDRRAIQAAGFIDLSAEPVNLHEDDVLLIAGDRIEGFVPAAELPDDVELEDHAQEFCLPGLVDSAFMPGIMGGEDHEAPDGYGEMVWNSLRAARVWLNTGVTAAGTLGAADRHDLDLHSYIQMDRTSGPRLVPALSPLVPLGADQFSYPYGVLEVSGPREARKAARQLIKNGAERITVYADVPLRFQASPEETSRERLAFSEEELRELVTQAEQAGCYVHAQAISTEAVESCARAGVRSIGCAFGLTEEQLPLLRDRGVALAPNLALGATVEDLGLEAGLSPETIQMVSKQRISADLLVKAHQAGVEVICGTNAAFQAGTVVQECELLLEAGLPLEVVLKAATISAAETLKPYCEWGALKPNYFADLLFLEGNPLESLDYLKKPVEVQRARNS
jgi:imidazolonepropionase-like amidohydrolase